MKTTHILLAAVLAATSAVQAAEHKLPAPLPEFKTPEQLVVWRKEMMAKAAAADALAAKQANSVPAVFYTGKPYVEETGSYAFMLRSYDPELARWTSKDQRGFPDGANCDIYVCNGVTIAIDPDGAKRVIIEQDYKLVVPGSAGYAVAGLTGVLTGAALGVAGSTVPAIGTTIGAATGFFGGTAAYFMGTYNSWGNNVDTTYVVNASGVGGMLINTVYEEVAENATQQSDNYVITLVTKDWAFAATQITFTANVYSAHTYVWE